MAKSSDACPTLSLIHMMGKKWTIPIIELLYPARNKLSFNELQTRLGRNVTARNLSGTLKELSDAGMIKRTERKENGIMHTSYSLTNKGLQLEDFIRKGKALGIHMYGMDPSCVDRRCSECALLAKN